MLRKVIHCLDPGKLLSSRQWNNQICSDAGLNGGSCIIMSTKFTLIWLRLQVCQLLNPILGKTENTRQRRFLPSIPLPVHPNIAVLLMVIGELTDRFIHMEEKFRVGPPSLFFHYPSAWDALETGGNIGHSGNYVSRIHQTLPLQFPFKCIQRFVIPRMPDNVSSSGSYNFQNTQTGQK